MKLKPVMTTDELARYLNVSSQTIRTWRMKNQGPRWVTAGRAIRYLESDVTDWLNENKGRSDV